MDNLAHDARPNEARGDKPQRRGPPPFKNQVSERSEPLDPEVSGKGALPEVAIIGNVIRNNQPPPTGNPQPQLEDRLPRADRVYPTQRNNAAPMFQAEYNYATSSTPPYIRDEDAPTSPVRQRPNVPKQKSFTPLAPAPKPKFGYSTSTILILLQCVIIFLFGVFVSYEGSPKEDSSAQGQNAAADVARLHKFYPFFQDVHVMIFVGFGFLMTFLRKYGYSAVGYNMLIAAIAIQWSVLCRGIFHHGANTIPISIESLINGDFAAGAVLISFGALLGVTNPLHLVTMCLIEVFLYALNEYIGAELFGAIDIGGSMWIHTFGAYFGLALSLAMRRNKDISSKNEGSSYNSDIFAMIGTIFLWLFWPSFNGVMATGMAQHRAVLNTVLSLSGSCVFSFAASSLMCPDNKFSMVHVQNASLAGGVAVGAIADLMIQPFGALVIGSSAGLLSTAGYVYLTPFLQRKLGLHDTCGVHNLHGMPGVLAGFIGVIMAAVASEDMYGKSLYMQYPALAPIEGDPKLAEILDDLSTVQPGLGRSAQTQALYQLAALFTTIGIAMVGGAITGLMLRIPCFGKVANESLFHDGNLWEVPEDEESMAKAPVSSDVAGYGALGQTQFGMEMSQEKRE